MKNKQKINGEEKKGGYIENTFPYPTITKRKKKERKKTAKQAGRGGDAESNRDGKPQSFGFPGES